MARTEAQVKGEIISAKENYETLNELTSISNVAIWRLFVYVVTQCILTLEILFDQHKTEVDTALYNQKSGRLPWYRTKSLDFQYGFDLLTDSDEYNNTGYTDEAIEASKIIKYSAVNEADTESRVIIKIAGENNSELSPITPEQKTAFEAYWDEIKYAGVEITVINYEPDILYLNLDIYFNPLILDANGMSITDGNYPVEEAIQAYMKELPFNGQFVIAHFVDKLQKVEGVEIPHVNSIQSSWIDASQAGYGNPVNIAVRKIPESGYFKVLDYSNINYIANN